MQNLKAIDTLIARLPWKDCHMQSNCMKYLYGTMDCVVESSRGEAMSL